MVILPLFYPRVMFEDGKCYAQFCVDEQQEEYVFVEKVMKKTDYSISILDITIDNDGLYYESSTWIGGFDDNEYVEIPHTLLDELLSKLGGKWQVEDSELARHYIAIFGDLCRGNWRYFKDE